MQEPTPKVPSPQELKDEAMINAAFQHLIDTYLASNHRRKVEVITKAFNFAKQAHKGVRRLSGEPYILHPIAVAQIVCEEIGLGSTSICAALLHDVEEDTDYTNEDIANIFGQKVTNTLYAGGFSTCSVESCGLELKLTAADSGVPPEGEIYLHVPEESLKLLKE